MAKKSRYEQFVEKLRNELPYGIWVCDDGTEVLFNRLQNSIWRRDAAGIVSPVQPGDASFVWRTQQLFYDDTMPPWCIKRTRIKCETVLSIFKEGGDVMPYLKKPFNRVA